MMGLLDAVSLKNTQKLKVQSSVVVKFIRFKSEPGTLFKKSVVFLNPTELFIIPSWPSNGLFIPVRFIWFKLSLIVPKNSSNFQ